MTTYVKHCLPAKHRDSVPKAFIGGRSHRQRLPKHPNSRLPEGKQVFNINHIVCSMRQCRELFSLQVSRCQQHCKQTCYVFSAQIVSFSQPLEAITYLSSGFHYCGWKAQSTLISDLFFSHFKKLGVCYLCLMFWNSSEICLNGDLGKHFCWTVSGPVIGLSIGTHSF